MAIHNALKNTLLTFFQENSGFAGLSGFLLSIMLTLHIHGFSLVSLSVFVVLFTAFPMLIIEFQRVNFAYSQRHYNFKTLLIIYAGLAASVFIVLFFYWVIPEYHGSFYDNYYAFLWVVLPAALLLAPFYLHVTLKRLGFTSDGYHTLGLLLLTRDLSLLPQLKQHFLGLLVKAFFLPLMYIYFINDLQRFINYDFSAIQGFKALFDFLYYFAFFIDVGMVIAGYIFTLKLFNLHVRSVEATAGGWLVALVCYQPFGSFFYGHYFGYASHEAWYHWLSFSPVLCFIWGSAILVLTFLYVWATISFGLRFSNLTNRGIITNGLYRWFKHPAYLFKNISWWMVSVPFIATGSAIDALHNCLLLAAMSFIYYLRAKTEERHLMQDFVYFRYAASFKAKPKHFKESSHVELYPSCLESSASSRHWQSNR